MIVAVLFALAAAAGAVARWSLRGVNDVFVVPVGTLAVNWFGALALGIAVGQGWDATVTTVVGTGFLGALTTFSTLSGELATLERPEAVLYGLLTVVGGVGLAWMGLSL